MANVTETYLDLSGKMTVQLDDGTTTIVDVTTTGSGGGPVTATSMATALSSGTAAERTAFRASGFMGGFSGNVANQTAMLSITAPLNVGDVINRLDTGTTWRYLGGAVSILTSWRDEGSASQINSGLSGKQNSIAAGTDKILAAPATDGGAPIQLTLGSGLNISGTTLNSTGAGSSTYAALTDKVTVDLPTINTPLNTALAGKAVVTTVITIDSAAVTANGSSTFSLTRATHDGKRVLVTAPGVVFTAGVDWNGAVAGVLIDRDGSGSFTLTAGANLVIPTGAAGGSATAFMGSVLLTPYGSTLRVTTQKLGRQSFWLAPVSDVAPASTSLTSIGQAQVDSMPAQCEVMVDFQSDATVTNGYRIYQLRISPTSDWTQSYADLALINVTAGNGKVDLALRFFNTASNAQRGGSPNITPGPWGSAGTAATRFTGTVDTSAGAYITLLIQKQTAADVVAFNGGLVEVRA